jgi:hypothetical protein
MTKYAFFFVFLFCFDVHAINLQKVVSIGTQNSTTQYKIQSQLDDLVAKPSNLSGYTQGGSNSVFQDLLKRDYIPSQAAPSGTNLIQLDAKTSASALGFAALLDLPIGNSKAAVNTEFQVDAADLAASVALLIPRLQPLGIALTAGSALYSYLSSAGYYLDSSGNLTKSSTNYNSCGGNSNIHTPEAWCQANNGGSGNTSPYITQGTRYNFYCPVGMLGYCDNGSVSYTPLNPTEKLAVASNLTPKKPANLAPLLKQIYDIDPNALPQPAGLPSTGLPNITNFPSTITPEPTTEVMPDGSVQRKTKSIALTKPATDTISATETTVTTTTKPDGSVVTSTSTGAPAISPVCLTSACCPTDCDKHPDYIGCAKFGTVPIAETLTTTPVTVSLNPTSLGSGTCPASKTMTVHGNKTITMSYQPECDFATKIKPLILVFAWLSAGFIVLGSVREA